MRPGRYVTSAIAPAMGARLTCTSKMFRKMLTRWSAEPSGFTATTLPSAGETATGPPGMARSGSRKKYRQKSARSHRGAANQGRASQETRTPAPAIAAA